LACDDCASDFIPSICHYTTQARGHLTPNARKVLSKVATHLPEINYIAFTGAGLAGDFNSKVPLIPHLRSHVSTSQLNAMSLGWNYADAACSLMAAGELFFQNHNDEVNDHQQAINEKKIIGLTGASIALATMTAFALGGWGFFVATVNDFGIIK